MTQATLSPKPVAAKSAETSAADSMATVRVDELIVGRPLTFPVCDNNGVLLLAAGAVITTDFKRLLQQRKIASVQVNRADISRISLTSDDFTDRKSVLDLSLDSVVAAQLDKVIDSGLTIFQNSGPAFKQEVVNHGRKAFQLEKQQMLRKQRTTAIESLNSTIKEALEGKTVGGAVVNQLAVNLLADMADDGDCSLSVAMEATADASIADHCFKMSMLATAIAIEMGMNEDNCRRVCVAGLVHDWGMARVPAELRQARQRLSNHEFFEIKKHPIYTAEILDRMPGLPSLVSLIAYQVHERPNGTGYPRARTGDRIHILARILGAADMFIALTEIKPYRRPLAPYSAMECLVRLARSRDVDPDVVRAMLKSMCLFPIGSLVALSDGSVAQVVRRNGDHYARPIVQRIQSADGGKVSADDASMINLVEVPLDIVQALPTPGRDEILFSDDLLYPARPRN